MDGRYTWTIREIIADPRYRAFAQSATAHGKQLLPDSYPWKHMGLTVEQFLALDLRHEDGTPLDAYEKEAQLGVVRAQEAKVVNWWHWWPGWEALDRDRTPLPAPGPRPAAGMLF
jgi:hypothetical protein